MKKSILSLLTATLVICSSLMAQEKGPDRGKTTVSFYGGLNVSRFTGTNASGDKIENDFLRGEHVGFNVELPLTPIFYFQPGIQLIHKGSKNSNADFTTISINSYYAQIPLHFVVKPRIGNGHLIVGVGPVLSYGLGGTWKTENPINFQNNQTGKVKFANTVTQNDVAQSFYLKSYDVATSIILGYQFSSKFYLQVNSERSVITCIPKYEYGSSLYNTNAKNTSFGITAGFRF